MRHDGRQGRCAGGNRAPLPARRYCARMQRPACPRPAAGRARSAGPLAWRPSRVRSPRCRAGEAGPRRRRRPHPRPPGRRPVLHWRAVVVPWRWFITVAPCVSVDPERGIRSSRFSRHPHLGFEPHRRHGPPSARAATCGNGRHARARSYLLGASARSWSGADGVAAAASAHFKLRAIQSTDFHRIASRGGTASTELRWREFSVTGAGSVLTASLEPAWASWPCSAAYRGCGRGPATRPRPAGARRLPWHGARPLAASVSSGSQCSSPPPSSTPCRWGA